MNSSQLARPHRPHAAHPSPATSALSPAAATSPTTASTSPTTASAPPSTEAAARADFSQLRYAQVWEDADVLLAALDVQSTDTVLSIAAAGDNALALLGAGAARVIALDLNPAQLAALELRVAAFRLLAHAELLVLLGARPGEAALRAELYARCRPQLGPAARAFWDARPAEVAEGVAGAGKFERYFALFRTRLLPWVHGRATVAALLRGGTPTERAHFYRTRWDTWRWRLLFRVFFSRFVMGRLGRDPAFFHYVEGSVAERILARTRHALTSLDPAANPYLHWILTGTHGTALPWAWREENFERIHTRLDRLEWHQQSLEEYLDNQNTPTTAPLHTPSPALPVPAPPEPSAVRADATANVATATAAIAVPAADRPRPGGPVHKFNLSDIFEYMSPAATEQLLRRLASASAPGGRLVYWNMLAPRRRPPALAAQLRPREDLAAPLFAQDKAFFYSALVIEDVV